MFELPGRSSRAAGGSGGSSPRADTAARAGVHEREAPRAGLTQRLRPHGWPAAFGLGLGLLALGPALRPGFVLSYDMVFVPNPPITTADLGGGGEPARAIPSDLAVALASRIMPAELLQKLILLAIFVLACSGAAALLAGRWPQSADGAGPPLVARLAAGVFYAWNPFVAERLIMGQWALLLGYAGLPWVLRELSSRTGQVRPGRLALAMLPAFTGGFAAMSITALAALPVMLFGSRGLDRADRTRRIVTTLSALVIASLPWIIPSLIVPVHADPAGAAVFAARADTPFGTGGSLVMLGGMWSAEAVPRGYGGFASICWLVVVAAAVAGYVAAARPRAACPGLGVAAIIGFCLAGLGSWQPTLTALRAVISFWPGFALLRDGQQFIAPLALAESIGLGAGVAALLATRVKKPSGRRVGADNPARGIAMTIGVLAVIASVVLLPGLSWGAVGRLRAVEYPADWLTARRLIDASPQKGSVLLLPWAQYRVYPWNNGEPVFDPWPRLLARTMIWNDALRVGTTTIAAESSSARRLGPVIDSGRRLTTVLRAAGVSFVVVDAGPLLGRPRWRLAELARLPGAEVVLASPDLVVFRLSR